MPFTLAHPAAVLPFRRYAAGSTSLAALVIGSLSPDFVYFFSLGVNGAFSHSLMGMFLFCVPASLAVYFAYYLFLRQPLIALLPDAIATRLHPRPAWVPNSISSMAIIVGSLMAGAATHIVWDAFTHGNTFVIRNVELLRTSVDLAGIAKMPLYKILQHVSSVFGLVILAIYTCRWMRDTPPEFARPLHLTRTGRTGVIAAILAAGIGGGIDGAMTRPARSFEHLVFNGVVSGMAAMALAILIFCGFWRIWTLREGARI